MRLIGAKVREHFRRILEYFECDPRIKNGSDPTAPVTKKITSRYEAKFGYVS